MANAWVALLAIWSCFFIGTEATDSDEFLQAHNTARAEVGVGAMTWSSSLYDYALSYAQSQDENCKNGNLVHSGGSYGENLFWGSGKDYSPSDAVASWVDEKKNYNYDSNSCDTDAVCGHYTQVVWENSVNLGCAKYTCDSSKPTVYIICSYDPRGNYNGEKPY